jgi:hypothetical protein
MIVEAVCGMARTALGAQQNLKQEGNGMPARSMRQARGWLPRHGAAGRYR